MEPMQKDKSTKRHKRKLAPNTKRNSKKMEMWESSFGLEICAKKVR